MAMMMVIVVWRFKHYVLHNLVDVDGDDDDADDDDADDDNTNDDDADDDNADNYDVDDGGDWSFFRPRHALSLLRSRLWSFNMR